jgi:hypothetical protein
MRDILPLRRSPPSLEEKRTRGGMKNLASDGKKGSLERANSAHPGSARSVTRRHKLPTTLLLILVLVNGFSSIQPR